MIKQRKQERNKKDSESIQELRPLVQVLQSKQRLDSILLLPFILHLAFMTFTSLFVMHVQVIFLPLAISQFTTMVASFFYIFLE